MKKVLWLLAFVIFIMSINITGALADAAAYDVKQADYYVYVATPDGGLNMRYGPGTEYDKVMQERIPDGVKLYIGLVSGNWGYTSYNGNEGWVALKQTTTTPPQTQTHTPSQSLPQTAPQIEAVTPIPPAQTETQNEEESELKTQTATPTVEQPSESDFQVADDVEPVSEMQNSGEDEQNVKKAISMQMLIVVLLILLIVVTAILLVIVINSKKR